MSQSCWLKIVVPGNPVAKPRMTKRDKWKQRPCVIRYREWADRARQLAGFQEKQILTRATRLHFRAYFAVPKSWGSKLKESLKGLPHLQRADIDNVQKAIMDSLFRNDQMIYCGEQAKFWDDGNGPRVEIEVY